MAAGEPIINGYADFGDGGYYAPPAVADRPQAAPYRLRDLCPTAPDVENTRRRLRDLLGDAPPAPPLISVVEIDGQRPTAGEVAAIEAELRKVPPAIVSTWRAAGGRIQIAAGRRARLDSGGRASDGWYRPVSKLLLVAAQAPPDTIIHEMGHAHDGSGEFPGRFSSLPAWRRICQGRPATPIRFSPVEHYAEDFRDYFFSESSRANMPPKARKFIAETTG